MGLMLPKLNASGGNFPLWFLVCLLSCHVLRGHGLTLPHAWHSTLPHAWPSTPPALPAALIRSTDLPTAQDSTALPTAQDSAVLRVAEGILAQIGDKIILQSELETEYRNALSQDQSEVSKDQPDLKCVLFEQMILGKMLQRQAELDSLVVPAEEIDNQLERRIRHFAGMLGGQEKIEAFYGKTMPEIREEFRPQIKDMLLSQKMRDKITAEVQISPAEVRAYFERIPEDSLPLVPAEVELGHLVLMPKAGPENRTLALEKIQSLRDRILKGESFATLAILYSQDPGSAKEGGMLGFFGRGDMVPEFEAVAFRLKPGEISPVVKTSFGYHLIQLVDRKGERISCRHLLVKGSIGSMEHSETRQVLDSLRGLLVQGRAAFTELVRKHSDDPESKAFGGMLPPPQGGGMAWPIDQLSPETYFAIEKLEPGQYSEVQPYSSSNGAQGYRVVLLKKRSSPHRTSLESDYEKIQETALQIKRIDKLNRWIELKAKETYVRLTPLAPDCPGLRRWNF